MTVITVTREARCKDCKFLIKEWEQFKSKYHRCSNENSTRFNHRVKLKTYACQKWELKYT